MSQVQQKRCTCFSLCILCIPLPVILAGSFHTWKQAQVVLALIFSIGEDSSVLPDHNDWREDGAAFDLEETPAKICFRALVSALQAVWYLSKEDASVEEIHTCHVVLRNAAIHAHLLHRLKQFVVNRKLAHKEGSGFVRVFRRNDAQDGVSRPLVRRRNIVGFHSCYCSLPFLYVPVNPFSSCQRHGDFRIFS